MRALRSTLSRVLAGDSTGSAQTCWCSASRRRPYSTRAGNEDVQVGDKRFSRDQWTNATPTILSKVPVKLYDNPDHPVGILRRLIESHFRSFEHLAAKSPVVTVRQNFDDLGFPLDHPGRSKTDSYYLNAEWMLRTHTSAHEVEHFKQGKEQWLLTADVYRRDEIDRSHYPVFHQMEGANVMPRDKLDIMAKENEVMKRQLESSNIEIDDPTRETTVTNPIQDDHTPEEARIVSDHLKNSLNGLVLKLFGGQQPSNEPLKVRWIEASFPWTQPSYEVEVLYEGRWLEILGCGVVRQDTLKRSDVAHKMGWAFGLGLERIAMVLFSIPDIRLFWSRDPRFLNQFKRGTISKFKPYSKYPECYKDFSFWIPDQGVVAGVGAQGGATAPQGQLDAWHENDFMENVRDVAGDLIETVEKIDDFTHPKTKRRSVCYRINYRSMDRSLSNEEINQLQGQVIERVVERMKVEPR